MKIKVRAGLTLLELLENTFPDSSKTHLKKAVRYGCVTLNGSALKQPDFLLRQGQTVEFKKYGDRDNNKYRPPFKILYEDDCMLAVIKPAGILSSGRTTEKTMSMFGMVNKYLLQKSRGKERAYTVHRLDREVSGILLFTKREEAKYALQDRWSEVDKFYYALVEGVPQRAQGTVESWLKENARQVVYSVANEEPDAKHAVTHYKTLGYYGKNGVSADKKNALYTLLQVKLETGRKNQIRVHLSDMGCPIAGDRKYKADAKVKRMVRLFAYSINFPHPLQEKRVKLELPLPSNFCYITDLPEY